MMAFVVNFARFIAAGTGGAIIGLFLAFGFAAMWHQLGPAVPIIALVACFLLWSCAWMSSMWHEMKTAEVKRLVIRKRDNYSA